MEQLLFIILLATVSYLAYISYGKIIRTIRLGKPNPIPSSERKVRLKRVLLVAFGQKKMFSRPIPALMHGFIYVAFLFTQIELIEIIIDGVTGQHRVFAPLMGGLYTFTINLIEVLSLLALIGTVVFLVRRLLLKVPRFEQKEMKGWPTRDALLILFGEILLIIGIFTMNGADGILQGMDAEHYPDTGRLFMSSLVFPGEWSQSDEGVLRILERAGWWLHVLVVFGFVLYLPYSKHLHILFAFFNVYYARLTPRGRMDHMPEIEKEIKSMLGLVEDQGEGDLEDIPDFGAKDVPHLYRRDILAAYSCTECGRCTSMCPANLTGKKLSPRKIMMDVRDRAEFIANNGKKEILTDGTSLFDVISKEEIHACTACQACVEACPILINPMDIILQLRRYEVLTEGGGPTEWVPMFTSIENSGVVWQMPGDRDAWTKELGG